MLLSCAFAPARETPDHIALAEELGYARAFVYDSPAFYGDLWATLARAADRTSRIGLASGVAVVDLRHVTVTASALLTLESLAPGRISFGVGRGGAAKRMLGRAPVRWSDLLVYTEAVRALLRGETIEWDGAPVALMHPPGIAAPFPVEIPVLFAIGGPAGERVAREHGNGIITLRDIGVRTDFDAHCRLVLGTVLEDGEHPASERVFGAAGAGASLVYHQAYASGNEELLASLPGSDELVAALDALPPGERAPKLWEGHLLEASALDREHMPPSAVAALTLTGTVVAIRAQLADLQRQGVSELVYQPAGPDIARELRAFAHVLPSAAPA